LYSTAKQLYTVYRTTETENSWEGNDREKVSFEAIPRKKQRVLELRWCQAADCCRGGYRHRKRTIADSGQPCTTYHHQLWEWRRLERSRLERLPYPQLQS